MNRLVICVMPWKRQSIRFGAVNPRKRRRQSLVSGTVCRMAHSMMTLITARNSNNNNTDRVEQNSPLCHIRNLFLSKKLAVWGGSGYNFKCCRKQKRSHLQSNLEVGCDTKEEGKKGAKTPRNILYENKEEKRIVCILMRDKHIFQNLVNKNQANNQTNPQKQLPEVPQSYSRDENCILPVGAAVVAAATARPLLSRHLHERLSLSSKHAF